MMQVQKCLSNEGIQVNTARLCRVLGIPRRTYYYKPQKSPPRCDEVKAKKIKAYIDKHAYAGYRTVAYNLGMNKNTVQRIFQIKGWQVNKKPKGRRPRAKSMPSVAIKPNQRWSTDMARVWCGKDRWCTIALVLDCCTRELLGWRLSKSGQAKTAEAALEEALIYRFGCLGYAPNELTLRSDNGLVFTSKHYTALVSSYGIKQEFITPYTPEQNGMIERFIRTLKEQCVFLNRFESVGQAHTVIRKWIQFYNEERPHQALGMKTPNEVANLVA